MRLVLLALVLATSTVEAKGKDAAAPQLGFTGADDRERPPQSTTFTDRFDEARRVLDDLHDARVLRDSGIALTVVGVIATVAGGALVGTKFCIDGCGGSGVSAGVGLLTLGQIGVAAGIPLWATGGVRVGRAERARLALGLGSTSLSF